MEPGSQLDLSNVSVAVFVFVMEGCHACEGYLPKLADRVGQRAGEGFLLCDQGRALPPGSIPVIIYDAGQATPEMQAFMANYNVTATPTTLILSRGPGSCKLEGTLTPQQIDQVLSMAIGARV